MTSSWTSCRSSRGSLPPKRAAPPARRRNPTRRHSPLEAGAALLAAEMPAGRRQGARRGGTRA